VLTRRRVLWTVLRSRQQTQWWPETTGWSSPAAQADHSKYDRINQEPVN
jgi:hypothetical protein